MNTDLAQCDKKKSTVGPGVGGLCASKEIMKSCITSELCDEPAGAAAGRAVNCPANAIDEAYGGPAAPAGAATQAIDGGGWCQILKRSETENSMFKDGTLDLGAIKNEEFAEFMFATGDNSKWMIMSKDEVYKKTGGDGMMKTVKKSWQNANEHTALMYWRGDCRGCREDPWIADHSTWKPDEHKILYGELWATGTHEIYMYNQKNHGGLFVYIRS